MAVLATRRGWLETRRCAASGSPCSRQLLTPGRASSAVLVDVPQIPVDRGSKDTRVTVILLCSEPARYLLPRWRSTPRPSDPVVPRPLARPKQVDPYRRPCAAVLA